MTSGSLLRSDTSPPSGTMWAALWVVLVLVPGATAVDNPDPPTQPLNGGGAQCGEYTNQMTEDGMCRLVAILPQLEERRCPDMFRCTDEVSYWLQENQERKQQAAALQETLAELQEELRNHRHRVKALEHQSGDMRNEEQQPLNSTAEQRFYELEEHYAEATTLLHLQGAVILDLQSQLHNLTAVLEQVKRSPGCIVNIVRPNPLMNAQEALHPVVQHVSSCPVDCASIYYNGVRRSGLYTVVRAHGGRPVEVYCDMDTDAACGRGGELRPHLAGFWLGNDHIHHLSTQGHYSLRIDLEDWSRQRKHALYQSFSGSVKDSFSWYHDRQGFSTPDSGNICAEISHGGWWYNQCFYANLNGVYYRGGRYSPKAPGPLGPDGIVWYSWRDSDYYSLRQVTMMIRPRYFRPSLSP
ncbi:hypothetical protein NHX12_026562 [Muraenolepis orangiensis]|uniref:Fibrinogen C-terminal domain-containing protein n=1 Tax=Muraenolepis orangiensis TaxID=630683 RepID=A0A9Q0IND3_9TELE|nr:hypothetical protein NHX12_026562 [Muraenolepis orangiensis]